MQDNELVESVLAGDLDAYGRLVGRYSGAMYRFAVSITGDHHRAEEATVDAFAECFLHIASLDDPSAFGGWLKTVVKRKCWRTRSRASENDISDYSDMLADDGRDRPDLCFSRSENIRRVREALGNLPPSLGETARLFYLDDCSVREIAERLSLPEGTVKRRLYDARQKLRKELYDMDENIITTDELERKIRRYVRELGCYKRLNGGVDDTYFAKIREMEQLIDRLPDDVNKNYFKADAMAFVASSVEDKEQRHKLYDEAREVGRENGNLSLLTGDMIAKLLKMISAKSQLKYLDETAIPEIEKYRDAPDYENSLGKLLCWRAWVRLKNDDCDITGAREDAERAVRLIRDDHAMNAVARAAVRAIDLIRKNAAFECAAISAVGERLVRSGAKLKYAEQPGFTYHKYSYANKLNFFSLFFYASRVSDTMFDSAMKPGDTTEGSDGATMTCVACDEHVTAPAGEWDGCVHYRLQNVRRPTYGKCEIDTWYRAGVGLVRLTAERETGRREEYLLSDCRINGGTGLLPITVGNRWLYTPVDCLPDWSYCHIERSVTHVEDETAIVAGATVVGVRRECVEHMETLDSDACVLIGDMLCDRWQIDDALGAMRAAVRANTSAESVGAALAGIETLTRFADYQKRGYRICPSSVSTQRVLVDGGKITTEYGNYSFAPYQLGKRGRYEDRIFGIKPLRYLQMLAGCLWNPEWKPGYTERREVPGRDGEVTIKAEEGGTVETPCGTFHDCLKLTLEAEKEGMEPGYYFKDRYSYMWCGRKEFWFAPGVGLVRHVCTWGDVISSEAVLTAFCQPASDGREYYPMHLGSRWEYEEAHLASEGYRAANIIAVQSGVCGRYEITTAQEFVYLGSVENYEKLPRMLK